MKSILEVLNLSQEYLAKRGVKNPLKEAGELIAHALHMKRIDLYVEHDKVLVESELSEIRKRLERRGQREPLQYIEGEVEFYDCRLKVTPAVLIPRPETEILVDKIVKELKNVEGKTLWDIGTGSGAIGIAIKKKLPALQVVISDLSPEALQIALENAKNNQVEVKGYLSDIGKGLSDLKVDYVVSNPPYVASKELFELEPEVKLYEPKEALIAGPTGLEVYERLAKELPKHLNPNARVWLEIGKDQGESVVALFSTFPWKEVKLEQDWSGLDRFIRVII